MAKRQRVRGRVIICADSDEKEQCGYISYGGFFEVSAKRLPMHRHDDGTGYPDWRRGPAEDCKVRAALHPKEAP